MATYCCGHPLRNHRLRRLEECLDFIEELALHFVFIVNIKIRKNGFN